MVETSRQPAPLREHLESLETRSALLIQHHVLAAMRQRLSTMGFVEMLPPIIGPVTDPGVRGSKQVDIDYYGHRYKLMTSAILYKQASLLAFDKIFCVAPNVRLEPPQTASTGRHLTEFHQLDVEIADGSRDDAMNVAEDVIVHAVRHVISELPDQLEALGRDSGAFTELLHQPFDRITHSRAVQNLTDLGHPQSPDAEIDWTGEKILSSKVARPVFITDYPKGSRGFYDRESRDTADVLRNFDLIAPEGYGELISGSEREFEYARIVTRMRETGENPAKYGWYLRMVKDGIRGSAGFGLGVERLIRYIAGLEYIWQAAAYPKLPGQVSP